MDDDRARVRASDAVEVALDGVVCDALATFARLPGATRVDEPDLTWVRSGTVDGAFNNVMRIRLDPDDVDRRVPEVLERFGPESLPATWWVGPLARPADLGPRLVRLGLTVQEPEFGMTLDLAGRPGLPAVPPGAIVERVRDAAGLDRWLTVMAAAYGWRDPSRAEFMRAFYGPDLASGGERTVHFVVEMDGQPAAGSSLLVLRGEAFVTNIATAVAFRRRGLGTLATAATLALARDLGLARAMLVASVEGRALYGAMGFREHGRYDRFLAGPELLGRLGPRFHRRVPA